MKRLIAAIVLSGAVARAEEFRIPSGIGSLRVALTRLKPRRVSGRPVLFVHGATFPSALAAGFRFGGRSWMESLAARGLDTWALDFLGYGKSDRYPEMAGAADGKALGRAPEAERQIASAVAFIRQKTGAARVDGVAHSWGTIPATRFAAAQPGQVGRLVLFGPLTRRVGPSERDPERRFWDVTAEFQDKRFAGLVPNGNGPLIAPRDLAVWLHAYIASDPTARQRRPPSVRVPSGPLVDADDAWNGRALYDAAQVRVPTLIVVGEWDKTTTVDDVLGLFRELVNAPERQLTLLDRGTHVMHLEAGRMRLHDAVAAFLFRENP